MKCMYLNLPKHTQYINHARTYTAQVEMAALVVRFNVTRTKSQGVVQRSVAALPRACNALLVLAKVRSASVAVCMCVSAVLHIYYFFHTHPTNQYTLR